MQEPALFIELQKIKTLSYMLARGVAKCALSSRVSGFILAKRKHTQQNLTTSITNIASSQLAAQTCLCVVFWLFADVDSIWYGLHLYSSLILPLR